MLPLTSKTMGPAHKHMPMGLTHEHMLMGQAHEHVLMGQADEHVLLSQVCLPTGYLLKSAWLGIS